MNKTLLLIICDFLLLSLIGFIGVREIDISESSQKENYNKKVGEDQKQAELIDLLESSLKFEQTEREKLTQSLEATETSLEKERETLKSAEKSFIADKNTLLQNLNATQEKLLGTEEKRSQLSQQILLLGQKSDAYIEKLNLLQKKLQSNESIIADYKQKLEEKENQKNELQKIRTALAVKQTENDSLKTLLEDQKEDITLSLAKIDLLEKEQKQTLQDNQTLNVELKTLEAEKRKVEEALNFAQAEAGANRIEKQTLEKIIDTTKLLKKEIDKSTPVSPHTIFRNFQNKKATVTFITNNKNNEQEISRQPAIIINTDQGLFAVLHTRNTPLSLTNFFNHWPEAFSLLLETGNRVTNPENILFLKADPRVMLIPVPNLYQQPFKEKAFPLAKAPFSYKKTVLISNNKNGNYGETQFKIDLAGDNHVKMLRKPFSRLLGIFTPGTSDFVFSQSGDLIGIMTNRNYCVLIRDLTPLHTLNINQYTKQKAQETQNKLSSQIEILPLNCR